MPPEIVALVPVPFAALFLGWLPHNDVAYDSTALWMHVASGVRGWSDRIGRLVPVLLVGLPLLAVAIPFAILLYGRWALLPALAGVCISLFLCGLGLSSIASVVAPYAVSRPGREPVPAAAAHRRRRRRPGRSSCSARSCSARPRCGGRGSPSRDDIEAATLALWGGLAIGVVVLVVGIAIGAVVFERRGGRLMEFAEST